MTERGTKILQFILCRHPTMSWSLIDNGMTQEDKIFDVLFVPIIPTNVDVL